MDNSTNPKKPMSQSANNFSDIHVPHQKNHGNKQNFSAHSDTRDSQQMNNDQYSENINDNNMSEKREKTAQSNESDKIKELEKERDELKEQVLRVAAELDNYRRRTLKEKREMQEYANERLLFNFLNLLDDLGKAVEAGKNAVDCDSMLKGLDLIYQKALKLFENEGVKIMENTVGKPFDVNDHEAIMKMPSELPEDFIISEVQPGYTIKDKVLRHAKVVTSAGEPKEEDNE